MEQRKCPCNNDLFNIRHKDNQKSANYRYPGAISTVGQMWEDVSYSSSNDFIEGILWGAKWTNLPDDELTWTINYGDAGVTYIDIYDNPSNRTNLVTPTSTVEAVVQTCMDDLAKIIGISLRKVTSIDDAILSFNFMDNTNLGGLLGIAIPPVPTNDSDYNTEKNYTSLTDSFWCSGNMYIGYNASMNFDKGSFNYITIVHELGHAIGLAHPHDTGGNSTIFTGVTSSSSFGTYNANLQPLTIMTYNDTNSPYVPNSSSTTAGFLGTFGPIDVVALQFMYGANSTATNTTYTFPSAGVNTFWETIWDAGGTSDTIDASSSNVAVTINLNAATIADATELAGVTLSSNLYGGFTIANGAVIENVITGTGDDTIIGNASDNQITITQGGDDEIDGGAGFDTVIIDGNSGDYNVTYYAASDYVEIDDGNNLVNLENTEKIVFNDREILISELAFQSATFDDIIEYGTTTLNHQWKTINLNNTYTNPVVIVSDPTFAGKQFCCVRIRNVTSNSFQMKLSEAKYLDGWHVFETICYLVAEIGNWTLGSQQLVVNEFNTNTLSTASFVDVNFSYVMDATPNLFTSIQTNAGADPVVGRTRNISDSGFSYAMQEEERLNRGRHVTERIGYIALTSGNYTVDTHTIKNNTVSSVTHINKSASYNSPFNQTPCLITKIVSFGGPDTSNTRIVNSSASGFTVRVHEEQSRDREIRHANETVAYLAISSG